MFEQPGSQNGLSRTIPSLFGLLVLGFGAVAGETGFLTVTAGAVDLALAVLVLTGLLEGAALRGAAVWGGGVTSAALFAGSFGVASTFSVASLPSGSAALVAALGEAGGVTCGARVSSAAVVTAAGRSAGGGCSPPRSAKNPPSSAAHATATVAGRLRPRFFRKSGSSSSESEATDCETELGVRGPAGK